MINIIRQINAQRQQITRLEEKLQREYSWTIKHPKYIKLARRRLKLAEIRLIGLECQKKKLEKQPKKVISDKLEVLFKIAKGLKPELSDKIDNLLIS